MKKAGFFAALIAILFLSIFLTRTEEVAKSSIVSSSYMEDVRIINMKPGQKQWEINTLRVDISDDGTLALMKTVTIDLPAEGMKVASNAGTYNIETRDLSLKGDIEATAEDYVIRTDHIDINSQDAEIYTDGKVVIEGKNFSVSGYGLRAFQQKVWIERDVKAIFF
jgi:LPS export ABC transporter protein LptC